MLQGLGEGALGTLSHIGKITDPITRQFASPNAMAASDANIRKITTPENTTQKIAKFGEQTGEFMAPTGAEEIGAKVLPDILEKGAEVLPSIAIFCVVF